MSLTDNEPCPSCGGDRLRPDHTGSGRCHAGTPPRTEDVLPGLAALEALRADFADFAAMAARHAAELEERRAEVERLRGLLRQVASGMACAEPPHPLPTDVPIDERQIPACGECLPCRAWTEATR